MYKKNFVSIYFTGDKIQLVKLNSKKDAVVKYASYSLPPGAIENHKVSNPQILSEAIKRIWSQMKLREKTVGIVIPEFATFTKTLKLPNLVNHELDEAVRWQGTEQLPFEKGNSILDWKVVSESENEKTVLVCAIATDVLTGYVDAVSSAGLYPLTVETPALSLIRMVDNQNKKRLILYRGTLETIMLVTSGQGITGSSVLSSADDQSALHTATQIVHHYAEGEVEEVYIGGYSFGQDFYNQIKTNVNAKMLLQLSQPLVGITPQLLHEYMVPISLQMQDPQAPNDEFTINLLPPTWVKHYKDQLLTRQAWRLSWISSLFVLICVVVTSFSFVFMNTTLANIKNEQSQTAPQSEEVVANVNETNKLIDNLTQISSYDIYPQHYINEIQRAKPNGIQIDTYSVNLEEGTATVTGIALVRQDLISFKEQLETNEYFAEVEIPISSLIAEENVEFSVDLKREVTEVKKPVPKLQL